MTQVREEPYKPPFDGNVVEALEHALRLARDGTIRHVVIAAIHDDDIVGTNVCCGNGTTAVTMIGTLHLAIARLQEQLLADAG